MITYLKKHSVTAVILGIVFIGLALVYNITINYTLQNRLYEETHIQQKEDYIKTEVQRVIEMIDNRLLEAPSKYQKVINLVKENIVNQQDIYPNTNEGELALIEEVRRLFPYIQYAYIDTTKEKVIQSSDLIRYPEILEENMEVFTLIVLSPTRSVILYMSDSGIRDQIKSCITPFIQDIQLDNNGIIRVTEILDYNGGANYAIQRIHGNTSEEDKYLSTQPLDMNNSVHYQTELNGINTHGEILYEFEAKDQTTGIYRQRMSYAKLYKSFDWIVSTEIYMDDVYDIIEQEKLSRSRKFYHEVITLSLIVITLLILLAWKNRLSIINHHYKKKNRELHVELLEKSQNAIEAQKENQDKAMFLSVISHEMRTPLNGIMGFLHLLDESHLNAEQEELVHLIEHSSKSLYELINDVLDVEKYSAGKMVFDEQVTNMKVLFNKIVKNFEGVAATQNIHYQGNIADELNVSAIVDQTKFNQLISNLISNAIKFTREGQVTLTAKGVLEGADIHITVLVEDTGIGIKEDLKSHLFKPFTQADSDISGRYGGTGLGLTICKEIVNHYHGELDYDSVYGHGTSFKVKITLPITEDDQIDLAKEDVFTDNKHVNIDDINYILVVEDNIVNQKLLSKFLDQHHINFDIAENGKRAVELVSVNTYDLILMDCQMPVMDGFEATKLIRKKVGSKLRIIAMTAYASKEDGAKCIEAGMNEVITKPMNLNYLRRIIGKKIHKTEPDSNDNDGYIAQIEQETNHLMNEVGFDYATCYDLIETYIHQTLTGLSYIKTQLLALDYDGVSKALHQLKGASGAVRIHRLYRKFSEGEQHLKNKEYNKLEACIIDVKKDPLLNLQKFDEKSSQLTKN